MEGSCSSHESWESIVPDSLGMLYARLYLSKITSSFQPTPTQTNTSISAPKGPSLPTHYPALMLGAELSAGIEDPLHIRDTNLHQHCPSAEFKAEQ